MFRQQWRLPFAIVALVVAVFASIALVPVTVQSPAPADGGGDSPVVGLARRSRVEIATTGDGPVTFTTPRLTPPETFREELVADPGPFEYDAATGRWFADGAGRFVIEGTFGDLEVDLLDEPQRGVVTINRESEGRDAAHEVARSVATGTWSTIEVPALRGDAASNRLFLFRGLEVRAGSAVSIGDNVVAASTANVSARELLPTAALNALRAWAILAVGVAITFACWCLGRALLGLLHAPRPPVAAAMAGGFALVAVVTNSLAYVMSVARAAVVLGLALAALVAFLVARRRAASIRVLQSEAGAWGRRAALTVPAALVAYFPLLSLGPWFAGTFKTDLYEYAALSSLVRGHSLLALQDLTEAQAAGTVTADAGFVWRSVDSVSASLVSAVSGTATVTGFTLLGVALFFVFGIGVVDLAGRLTRSRALIAALAVFGPLAPSLFLEDYLSQYFFVAFIPSFLVAAAHVASAADDHRRWVSTIALAAISAVMTAAYPYFFLVVLAAAGLAALSHRDARRALRRLALPIAVQTALLTNLALITVVRYGETRRYERALDDIARNVLLAGWSRLDVLVMAAGGRSFGWRDSVGDAAGIGGTFRPVLAWSSGSIGPAIPWLALAAVGVVALLVAADARRTFAAFDGRLVLAVVTTWTAFAAFYALTDRPYIFMKAVWVAGALIPCAVAVTRWRGGRERFAAAGMAAIAVVWIGTSLSDRLAWVAPLESAANRTSHVSTIPDLVMLADRLHELEAPIVLVAGDQPIEGSDHDRVIAAHTTVMLRDGGLGCDNCNGDDVPVAIDCEVDRPRTVIVIGLSDTPATCGLSLLDRGTYTEIYSEDRP